MALFFNREKKSKSKVLIIAISILGLLMITKLIQIYNKIEIVDYNKYSVKEMAITVEEKNNQDLKLTDMLDSFTKNVVGVSRLKDNGNTIFKQDGVEKMGMGSGVIISENGYVLTNEHVSGEQYGNCYVTMEDGKNYKANVIWSDSNLDLAIIKINMKCINYAQLGDSNNLKVGQSVYAIGNPIGFEFQKTVTSGIISAMNRTIVFDEKNQSSNLNNSNNQNQIYMSNLIQTDATINPGNSGGPLINNNGEIIGINTVKITSAEGIGFAVPINVIKPIIQKLETDGKFNEPSLGIFAYDKNVIPYLNSNIKFDTGIYVAQISMDSPAFNSGLQIGDVITQIDEVKLEKMCDLREYIYSKNIGDIVKLNIIRNNKEKTLEVKLGKKI